MHDLASLRKRANKIKSILDNKVGIRQTHLDNLNEEKKAYDLNNDAKKLNLSSVDLLNTASFQRRKNTIAHLEHLVDAFVKAVYGDDYTFILKSSDTSFTKIEPIIQKPIDENNITDVDLKDGSGGGLLDMCAFATRLACNEIENYNGPLFLDETFKSLSADKKIYDLIVVLQSYFEETQRQCIFINHKAEVYGKIADMMHLVELINKKSKVSQVTFEEIVNDYTFKFNQTEEE